MSRDTIISSGGSSSGAEIGQIIDIQNSLFFDTHPDFLPPATEYKKDDYPDLASNVYSRPLVVLNDIDSTKDYTFIDISMSSNGYCLAVVQNDNTDFYVKTSDDSGLTWSEPIDPFAGYACSRLCKLLDTGQAIVVGDSGWWALSTDYGVTWSDWDILTGYNAVWHAVHLSISGRIILANSGAMISSNDFGLTWTETVMNMNDMSPTNLFITEDGHGIISGSSGDEIMLTDDYGVTWSDIISTSVFTSIYGIAMSDNRAVLVGYASNVSTTAISSDYGNTWEKGAGGANIGTFNHVTFLGEEKVILVRESSLYKSEDYGSSWDTSLGNIGTTIECIDEKGYGLICGGSACIGICSAIPDDTGKTDSMDESITLKAIKAR